MPPLLPNQASHGQPAPMPDTTQPDPELSIIPEEVLLRNPIRRAILQTLQRTPGLNTHQVTKRLDANHNTIQTHLGLLVEATLVTVYESPRGNEYILFHIDDDELWDDERTRILYGRAPTRNVALIIANNPGMTTGPIADTLQRTKSTVRYHIRILEEHDLIARHRFSNTVYHNPLPTLNEWVDDNGHAYTKPWDEDHDGQRS